MAQGLCHDSDILVKHASALNILELNQPESNLLVQVITIINIDCPPTHAQPVWNRCKGKLLQKMYVVGFLILWCTRLQNIRIFSLDGWMNTSFQAKGLERG